jgi:hypothetical protein
MPEPLPSGKRVRAVLLLCGVWPAAAEPLTLDYATYFGGGLAETPSSIHRDGQGNVILVGTSESDDFPVRNLPTSRLATYCTPARLPESYPA